MLKKIIIFIAIVDKINIDYFAGCVINSINLIVKF